MAKRKQVVLSYAGGVQNAGDHALTLGALELLCRQVASEDITVIARFADAQQVAEATQALQQAFPRISFVPSPFHRPQQTRWQRYVNTLCNAFLFSSLSLFPRLSSKVFSKNPAIHSLANARMVLCNGGNLWCEGQAALPPLLPLLFAKRLGIPYGFLPQSVGSLDNALLRQLARGVFRKAAFMLLREQTSLQYLKTLLDKQQLEQHYRLLPDLAFVRPYMTEHHHFQASKALRRLGIHAEDKFIAVTLQASQFGDPEGISGQPAGQNLSKTISDYMCEVILPIVNEQAMKVLVVEQADGDQTISAHFQQALQAQTQQSVVLLSSRDPSLLSQVYAQAECLVGMRLHSLIFALRMYKPALALYLPQFGQQIAGVYQALGLGSYCLNMQLMPVAAARQRLLNVLAKHDELSEHLSQRLERGI